MAMGITGNELQSEYKATHKHHNYNHQSLAPPSTTLVKLILPEFYQSKLSYFQKVNSNV